MEEGVGQQGSVKDFLTVLFKHKSKILTIFCTVVVVVTVLSFVLPPTYEAQSSLLVKFGREFVYQPEVGDRSPQISIGAGNQEELINSEVAILTNRDVIRRVITTIGVEKLYPGLVKEYSRGITPVDMATLKFEKDLTVEGVKKSNVIDVSYQHQDPRLAARAVNLLVEYAKDKHLQVYSDPKSSFLEGQVGDYSEKLNEAEDKLQTFKQRRQVYSLDEQRNLLLKQRIDLDTSLKVTQNSIQELREKLATLNTQASQMQGSAQLYTPSERDRIIVDAKAKLTDLQIKEAELLVKYKPNNKLVVNVRDDIRRVKAFLQEQEDELRGKLITANPVYQEIEKESKKTEADLKAQETKGRALISQVQQVDKSVRDLDFSEKDLQTLKREVATNEKNYTNYLEKYEEALIADDMNRKKMANINVMQTATVPANPKKPRKALNILLSMILGAVAGIGYAFASEYSAQGLSTPESLERHTGLRVLATVPMRR
jgi:uncharacterized protein involved in exopolysaccharide biosynthesis